MYEYDTYVSRDPSVRAGDADREEVGERLRQHHAEGRLDAEEFQQRIDHCYQAKTVGELQKLVADLPRERERRTGRAPWPRRFWPIPLISILLGIWAISLASGHNGHFGFLFLIPLFFLIRFLIWPYGRWGMRRHYGDQRQF
jgi:hypothetical protein